MISIKGTAGAGAVLVALSAVLAASASADVVPGQYLTASKYSCGGQERITGGYWAGPAYFQEKSWIFRNCGTTSVRRKADVINDWDGDCYSIPAGTARVLEVKYAIPRQVYRGSIVC